MELCRERRLTSSINLICGIDATGSVSLLQSGSCRFEPYIPHQAAVEVQMHGADSLMTTGGDRLANRLR